MTPEACVVCGCEDISEYRLASALLDLPGNTDSRVMRCERCSFMFLFPYFSNEALASLYSPSYFAAESVGQTSTLAPASPDLYRCAVMSRMPKFRATLALFRRLSPTAHSVFDIGAGTGEFVLLAREQGFEAEGLEFSEFAAREAQQRHHLKLTVGDLSTFRPEKRYDVVHLNHVFEHLSSPHDAIRSIENLLAHDGILYVEVPFQFNWIEKIKYVLFRTRPSFNVHSLHHPVFFTPKTLTALFQGHGFRCEHLTLFDGAHYPLNSFGEKVKSWVWRALAVFQQGLFIEAVFRVAKSRQ